MISPMEERLLERFNNDELTNEKLNTAVAYGWVKKEKADKAKAEKTEREKGIK